MKIFSSESLSNIITQTSSSKYSDLFEDNMIQIDYKIKS